jgi:hypothetical protein
MYLICSVPNRGMRGLAALRARIMPARHGAGIIPAARLCPTIAICAIRLPLLDRTFRTCSRECIVERSKTVSPEDHYSSAALTGSQSRRAALHAGGALLAGLGALAIQRSATAQSTPIAGAGGGGSVLVQSFSHGTLFPTQGDVEGVPYTVILWDAADRGFFFADVMSGVAGVVPSERVLAAIGTESSPRAVIVGSATEGNDVATPAQGVWALSLVNGSLGSDPGAVTYQGEPLASEDATSLLGTDPAALPEGPQELGQGFIIIAGLSGFDGSGSDGVQLNLT